MSRCFPFPPPGYKLNDESLIESIKRAEEKARKEQRRKERKREKKEKKERRKEKKEKKRKEREERRDNESENRIRKRRHKEEEGAKDVLNQKVEAFRKLKETGKDCLEKSSLTVERELLQTTSPNSCDSTLNNSNEPLKQKEKEKQQQLLDGGRHNNDSESIIRIRLPIRRQIDPEVTNNNQQKPCPLDSSQEQQQPVSSQHPCSTSAPEHASKPHEEKRKDPIFKKKKPSSLCTICSPSIAIQFLNVIENWVPNTIVELTNLEDEETSWLIKKPSSGTQRCKQLNETEQVISSSMAWPRARLLPEAEAYALPYTVPF